MSTNPRREAALLFLLIMILMCEVILIVCYLIPMLVEGIASLYL